MKRLRFTLFVFLAIMTGCGSSTRSPITLAGNWQLSLDNNSGKIPSGFLLQSGNSLNGDFLISGNCSGVGTAQGQLSGANVNITVDGADQSLSLTGTVSADGSSMSGQYSNLASGCGFSETGNWTASKVKDFAGTFQGTFTSVIATNLVFHFSGTVAQGSNTGSSFAALSGNMNSSDSPCFSSAVISGQVSGTAVVLNLLDANGVALGKIDGNTTFDASSMTGNYYFINTKVPLSCGSNGTSDFGTFSLTMQSSGS